MSAPHGGRAGPFPLSIVVLVVGAAAGFVGVALAWRGVAALVDVSLQVPYVVSGALGGIGFIGFAVGILNVQARRLDDAHERAELDHVVEQLVDVVATVRRDLVEHAT